MSRDVSYRWLFPSPPPWPQPHNPFSFFPLSVFHYYSAKKSSVNANGKGCTFKPVLSAIDDHAGFGGGCGQAIQADLPQRHCLQKKGKIEIDLQRWYRAGQVGQRIQLPLFQPHEMPADPYRAPTGGIFKVNLLFHTLSQGSTFRCPGQLSTIESAPIG